MTEKRFIETISTGLIKDNQTGIEYPCEMRIDEDFLNLVNTIAEENEQLKQFIDELTTKGTGKIHLVNGSIYKVDAILIDFKGDVE